MLRIYSTTQPTYILVREFVPKELRLRRFGKETVTHLISITMYINGTKFECAKAIGDKPLHQLVEELLKRIIEVYINDCHVNKINKPKRNRGNQRYTGSAW